MSRFRVYSRIVSLILVLSLLSSLGACKKADTGGEKVSADTPWYECETINCVVDVEDVFIEYQTYQVPIGKLSDGYVFGVSTWPSPQAAKIYLFSDEGDLLADMSIASKLNELYPNLSSQYSEIINDLYIHDGSLKMKCMDNNSGMLMIFDIDILAGTISLSDSYEFPQAASDYNFSSIYRYDCGDYELFVNLYDNFSILTVGPGEEAFCFTPDDNYSRKLSGYETGFIPISDTQVIFYDYQTYNYFIYDMANGSIIDDTDEYEWIKLYVSGMYNDRRYNIGSDGNLYFITSDAVAVLDYENSCFNNIVMLENMDLNRSVFCISSETNAIVVSADEDSVEFLFAEYTPSSSICGFDICEATRSEVNPNVGKTIITTDGYGFDTIYDAIYSFNRSDDEYFIRLVPNVYTDEERSSYASDIPEIFTRGEVGSSMMVDLMAGDCPDVVFYVSSYGQLNNGNCMMDMMPFYEESSLQNGVFDNIIRACESDGGLYAMPLSFVLNGILVDRSKYDVEGSGMTFTQFEQFTDSYCNGFNVISQSQTGFISDCLSNEYDLFGDDNSINFDCPEFRELAEYTSENVFNVENEVYWDLDFQNTNVSSNTRIEGYLGWFSLVQSIYCDFDDADLIGLPSSDSRGPVADITCFVSITQGTESPEGAWRFIETLLSHDVQRHLCKQRGTTQNMFPINREAFDTVGLDCIEIYNYQSSVGMGIMGSGQSVEVNDLDTIKNITETVEHITRADTDVDIIVYEEIQSYLVGDKSLDDVIYIMNDRARLMLGERG